LTSQALDENRPEKIYVLGNSWFSV
jgi:hypothetical protein